jgi:betaine-aldehyde dehydrogenase
MAQPTNKQISLWLTPLPLDATQSALRKAVESAADAHSGPRFEPHVTLHTAHIPEADIGSLLAKLKDISAGFGAHTLPVHFSSLKTGTTRHQSVLVEAQKSESLLKLKTATSAALGGQPAGEYYPHLSVWYGEDNNHRQEAFKSLTPKMHWDGLHYTVTGIDVVCTDGPEDAWTPIARIPLGTNHVFRISQFIGGHWVGSSDRSAWLPVVNPANKQIFHAVPAGTAADIDAAVQAAKKALPGWSATSAEERARLLRAIAEKIKQRSAELGIYETVDNGKPLKESLLDIADAAACFEYYADEIIRVMKEEDNKLIDVGNPSVECRVQYHAAGVCGLIIPWNYPLLMAAWKVAPALAAGCTAVLKPSEITPVTALELAAIAAEVGVPAGVLNVVNGLGANVGAPLSSHPDVAKVAFTGSVATGSRVAQTAVSTIKNVTLELGGKSPIIVFEDADLEQTADWAMLGIFFNQGQVCSATSRMIVHSSVKEKLLAKMVEAAKKIKVGSGLDETVEMGPIVSEAQYHRVLGYVDAGVKAGASLLCGGAATQSDLSQGYFVLPTIFDNVSAEMKIWKEEIFGPVLCVHTFETEEEAIKLANDTSYGLAAAIMSTNTTRCNRVARALGSYIFDVPQRRSLSHLQFRGWYHLDQLIAAYIRPSTLGWL